MNSNPTSIPVQLEYNNVYIRSTRTSDCEEVGVNMRHIDKLECLWSSGSSPTHALLLGLKQDYHTWTICAKDDKEPLACFGIGELIKGKTNYIWLLSTDRLLKVAGFEFAKASKVWLSFIVNHYKLPCVNKVHTHNTTTVRWLKWCGASFSDEPESDFLSFQINPSLEPNNYV